jgi:hypothetical protein
MGLILLPNMFCHPFQLFVSGLLANSFANLKEANLAGRIDVCAGYGSP